MNADIERECPLHWDTQNPVALIDRDIDALMARIPTLPAWAAHQIAGWSWAEGWADETEEAYIDDAQAESEYAHSEGAHS